MASVRQNRFGKLLGSKAFVGPMVGKIGGSESYLAEQLTVKVEKKSKKMEFVYSTEEDIGSDLPMAAEESGGMEEVGKGVVFQMHQILLLVIAVLAIPHGAAMAFSALQFDTGVSGSVSVTGGCVVAWVSTSGGVIARPSHANGVGWALPKYGSKGGVGFSSASGTVSPISFPLSETGFVARAFIVAAGAGASFGSTLLDAPCPLRLMPSEQRECMPSMGAPPTEVQMTGRCEPSL